MGTLKLNTTSGGSLSIQAADGASDNTLTLPAVTGANIITSADSGTVTQGMIGSGVAGSGPAFHAVSTAGQTVNNSTDTKVQINSVTFDTDSCFDSSTNYRFTPTVAGYYYVNGNVIYAGGTTGGNVMAHIWKNGSYTLNGSLGNTALTGVGAQAHVSGLLYMNGSTDYIELYTKQFFGISKALQTDTAAVYFGAVLVRKV